MIMERIYANLIENGASNPKTGAAYTIDDVPKVLKKAVQSLLDAERTGDD